MNQISAYGVFNETVLNYACSRSVSAVSCSESVVYVDVGKTSQFFTEALVVFSFFFVETKVFKQYAFAVFTSVYGCFLPKISSSVLVCGGQEGKFSFCLASHDDVKAAGSALCAALNGRGGGKPPFFQGSLNAESAQIQAFWER